MREAILNQIASALALRNNYFIREQDVQQYLANHLLQTNQYANVFSEYQIPGSLVPPYLLTDANNNNNYIDIVVEIDNLFYPIEIRYKTVAHPVPHSVFGQNVNIVLGHLGSPKIGCYDFWKDIKRIEFFEANFARVQRGIVLFISNDPNYRRTALSPNTGHAAFSTYQDRQVSAGTILDWNGNASVANKRPGFSVNYHYHLNWIALPQLQQHYYLLV